MRLLKARYSSSLIQSGIETINVCTQCEVVALLFRTALFSAYKESEGQTSEFHSLAEKREQLYDQLDFSSW